MRNINETQRQKINDYIKFLESKNIKSYYPARDTNQNDSIGFRICMDNRDGIKNADEVHIFWDSNSQGSLFDLGMAFALNKKLVIVNIDEVVPTATKSFANMILYWNSLKTQKIMSKSSLNGLGGRE